MAWNDLTAIITIMRDDNTKFFSSYTDEQLTALKRGSALQVLESDVLSENKISNGSDEILNEFAANYSDRLNLALTYKQLESFYFENNNAEGSLTASRFETYKAKYNEAKRYFQDFELATVTDYITTIRTFKIG